jgi:hypothetical protein
MSSAVVRSGSSEESESHGSLEFDVDTSGPLLGIAAATFCRRISRRIACKGETYDDRSSDISGKYGVLKIPILQIRPEP